MANLCNYCGIGNEFFRIIDENQNELLKCITCGHNNKWEDIFPIKVKGEKKFINPIQQSNEMIDELNKINKTTKIDKQDNVLINKK